MPYTIPVGPYHPALEEPYKVNVRCVAETVQQVSVDVGFSFRGIELLAQRREWVPDVTLIERVCGICSNVHAMTFCRAAEQIAGIEVPARARYIRTIISELERLHSHLLWAGLAAEFMGFQTLFMEVLHAARTGDGPAGNHLRQSRELRDEPYRWGEPGHHRPDNRRSQPCRRWPRSSRKMSSRPS